MKIDNQGMTIKRLILILLTILTMTKVFFSLVDSFSQPQVQSRLELYQTNLILHASQLKPEQIDLDLSDDDYTSLRQALLGKDPYQSAFEQYDKVLKQAQNSQNELSSSEIAREDPLDSSPAEQIQQFINELNLKLGLIAAQRDKIDIAQSYWQDVAQSSNTDLVETLQGLWSQPPVIRSDTESQITTNLSGWFRYQGLKQLYQLNNQGEKLLTLETQEQAKAAETLVKLLIIGVIPFVVGIIGVGLIIFLLAQKLLQPKGALLSTENLTWETPWDGEIIWQIFIVGFFFIGEILLPLLFGLSGFNPIGLSLRQKAFYVLVSYLLMASAGLLVLYLSIKEFLPLPKDWFKFKVIDTWIFWGLGGYFVAIPLVLLVSLLNQQLWQGQGGSNPLLSLALESQDKVALAIFFFTASIAAPFFEEVMFRGFLLPSLTRYIPVSAAIVVSSFIFAVAHLSVSEVLPLMTLGIILGFVYTRSRNLLSSICLHSLWNSGTLLSLFILGSG